MRVVAAGGIQGVTTGESGSETKKKLNYFITVVSEVTKAHLAYRVPLL